MADEQRTKERLLEELAELRRRLDGLLEAEAESKRTAEALRESEERYRSFVENFRGIAFRGDMEFVPYFFHGAVEAITGYTQEEFLAGVPRWDQIIHPDDLPGYLSQLLGRPDFTTDREYRIVRKDEQVRWVREIIQVVYGEPGELRYVDGVILDITDLKRREEELRRRHEELAHLYALAETLSRSLDTSDVVNGGLEKALEIIGAECGGIYIADQATGRLNLAAHRGVSEKFVAQVVTYDMEHETMQRVSELGRAGKPVLVTDLLSTDKYFIERMEATMVQEGLHAYLMALIQSKGVPTGLLVVATREIRSFTPHDGELLSTITNEIGMAIENSALYEEVRARSTYLETLQRINSTLRSAQPLPTVLDTIVQSATVAFDYAGSLIITPDESRDRLVFAAASGGMLMEAALKLTGLKLEAYSLPLEGSENPMARAFLTGELEAWGGDPPRIVKGVQPSISPMVASAIARAMRGQSAACVPLQAAEKTVGVLTVISHRPVFSDDEVSMLLGLANQAGLAIENAKLYEDAQRELAERKMAQEELSASVETLERTLKGAVSALAATTKYRDPYTAGHQELVTDLACAIAKEMGLPEARIDGLRVAGQLHDLGKIALPAEVLTKPSKLTETETLLIRTHVQAGYEILTTIDFPWPVAEIVLQHHERMDGSGYPQGLAGDDILLEARILAVADVVEAMARHRPYRPALGIDKALEEISLNKGVLFDPTAVDACLKLITEGLFDLGQPPALVSQPQS
jgi:PAS domain S-box-containing protein/putative nucleotidyltransferase with HDIG domain